MTAATTTIAATTATPMIANDVESKTKPVVDEGVEVEAALGDGEGTPPPYWSAA